MTPRCLPDTNFLLLGCLPGIRIREHHIELVSNPAPNHFGQLDDLSSEYFFYEATFHSFCSIFNENCSQLFQLIALGLLFSYCHIWRVCLEDHRLKNPQILWRQSLLA
ncbi:hypothetical protein PoB_000767100 [Plakobranchus ocellatus]|uniref:Uncharacterized protein n=1 Tax=Plakobranchus ocellatus TaxID=259542 RepID=A0AAV3YDA4_9GAST|nr:hypothetical protein PoB_000767100 [Plakobranchus ocellatus]